MSDADNWNVQIIAAFRENGGMVGGQFEGSPLLLLHSTGAKSGKERVNPVMYERLGDGFAVFASKARAPTNPDWFHNLVANPHAWLYQIADNGASASVVLTSDRRRIARDLSPLRFRRNQPATTT